MSSAVGTQNYTYNAVPADNSTVYNSNVDDSTYGSCFGWLRRELAGADYTADAYSGSRSNQPQYSSVSAYDNVSTRGCIVRVLSWG